MDQDALFEQGLSRGLAQKHNDKMQVAALVAVCCFRYW